MKWRRATISAENERDTLYAPMLLPYRPTAPLTSQIKEITMLRQWNSTLLLLTTLLGTTVRVLLYQTAAGWR